MKKYLLTMALWGVFFMTNAYSAQWENILPQRLVKTVFFQGIFASQVQAARYMGSQGFIATTGERVTCAEKNIEAIHALSIAPELAEVLLDVSFDRLTNTKGFLTGLRIYPLYLALYYRGVLQNYWQGISVIKRRQCVKNTVKGFGVQFSLISIGQEGDIANHINKMKQCGVSDKILYGVSRGSAASFVAYALHHADELYKDVKLVILEGAYDTIERVMRERHSMLTKWIGAEDFFYNTVLGFTAFKRRGITPLSVVDQFPKETPVLFITSKIDTKVPSLCAKNLASALVKSGHKKVYWCELNNSSHAGYPSDDLEDRQKYQVFLHTLYKEYQLPYIAHYATGEPESYRFTA